MLSKSDEDTTSSFFKDYYPDRKSSDTEKHSKVQDVCSKLIEICESQDPAKFYLVILSCYAKMKELEKALHRIIKTKGEKQIIFQETVSLNW